jgi:hypothetical protein
MLGLLHSYSCKTLLSEDNMDVCIPKAPAVYLESILDPFFYIYTFANTELKILIALIISSGSNFMTSSLEQ